MKVYQTKTAKLTGTDFREVYQKAFGQYRQIKRKTKRRPYIRSAYFNKDKIFLELFWHHLREKQNFRDKIRRMRYFPCAIELIQNSRFRPASVKNYNRSSEILHRFIGVTRDDDLFFVQIKENKKTGNKWLISIFPPDK